MIPPATMRALAAVPAQMHRPTKQCSLESVPGSRSDPSLGPTRSGAGVRKQERLGVDLMGGRYGREGIRVERGDAHTRHDAADAPGVELGAVRSSDPGLV